MKHVAPPELACEAVTRYKGQRCPNQKSIRISGKGFCKRHAAWEALHLAMKGGTARRIKRAYPEIGAVPVAGVE